MESLYGTEKNNNKQKKKKRNQYLRSVLDWKEDLGDLMGRYDCL